MFPQAEEIMGGHVGQMSPRQLTNCMAGIDVNEIDDIKNTIIFNDSVVGRKIVAKRGICALLTVCILSDNIETVAVNELSRFGSDSAYVLFVREVILQTVGRLIVVNQLNFNHLELIAMEDSRRTKLELRWCMYHEKVEDLHNQISDPSLQNEQRVMSRIANLIQRLSDYAQLKQVSRTDVSQRMPFSEETINLLRPMRTIPKRRQQRHSEYSHRLAPSIAVVSKKSSIYQTPGLPALQSSNDVNLKPPALTARPSPKAQGEALSKDVNSKPPALTALPSSSGKSDVRMTFEQAKYELKKKQRQRERAFLREQEEASFLKRYKQELKIRYETLTLEMQLFPEVIELEEQRYKLELFKWQSGFSNKPPQPTLQSIGWPTNLSGFG
jgi:hypothetical protein